MLVLSRKLLEGIVIGEDIRITVVKVDRNHVRLGIEAPSDVNVVREELLHPPEDEELSQARAAWDASETETEALANARDRATPGAPNDRG